NYNKRKVTESEFEPQKKWDPNNKNNYTKDKPMFNSNKENHTACVQAGNSFRFHSTTGKSLEIVENNRAEKQKLAIGSNSIELGKRKDKQAEIKEELEMLLIFATGELKNLGKANHLTNALHIPNNFETSENIAGNGCFEKKEILNLEKMVQSNEVKINKE
ncbi:42387_t:CDS:2, partial [Gigaspora margarita]